FYERRKRNHLPPAVLHIKLTHIFHVGAVITLRLDIDLPLPAKAVEIIDKQSAHERLNGPVDIVDAHALLDHFVTVNIHELLRHTAQKGRTHACDFGALTGSRQKCTQVCRKKLNILAGAILQYESEPSRCTDARDGGRRKIESYPFRQLAQLAVQSCFDFLKLFLPSLSIIPWFQCDEEESVVTGTGKAEQAEDE